MRPWLVLALAGCGRIGFGDAARGDGGDAPGGDVGRDTPSGLQPIHRYRFAGNYDDDFGGPPLTPHGGSFGAGGYQFGVNQGLSVDNALPANVYTVDIELTFANVSNWEKILDYEGLTLDSGFYVYEGALQYVIVPGSDFVTGAATLGDNVPMRTTLTRDASKRVVGYLGRAPVPADRPGSTPPTAPTGTFAFDDTLHVAALTGTTATFFIDDAATSAEASAGSVRQIAIYDVALTAAEIAALP